MEVEEDAEALLQLGGDESTEVISKADVEQLLGDDDDDDDVDHEFSSSNNIDDVVKDSATLEESVGSDADIDATSNNEGTEQKTETAKTEDNGENGSQHVKTNTYNNNNNSPYPRMNSMRGRFLPGMRPRFFPPGMRLHRPHFGLPPFMIRGGGPPMPMPPPFGRPPPLHSMIHGGIPPSPLPMMRDPRFMGMRIPNRGLVHRGGSRKKNFSSSSTGNNTTVPSTVNTTVNTTSSATSAEAPKSGIKPLMSIKTSPSKVLLRNAVVGRGHNVMNSNNNNRNLPTGRGMTRLVTKRPGSLNDGYAVEEPQAKLPNRGSQVHSNLRQIQTVDDAPSSSSSSSSSSMYRYNNRGGSNGHSYRGRSVCDQLKAVSLSHKPSPALTRINIDHGPPPPPQEQLQQHATSNFKKKNRVKISNLPASVTFERISSMTTACGNVKTIKIISEDNSAVIEFVDPLSAENFYRQNNRKMMDLSILNISMM